MRSIRNPSVVVRGQGRERGRQSGVVFNTHFRKCLLLYAESLAVHGDIMLSEGDM